MAITVSKSGNGYFTINDDGKEYDCQPGGYQAIYEGANVTIIDRAYPLNNAIVNNTPATSIIDGATGLPFATPTAFKTWWRANTVLTPGNGGGGGGGGTASTYPKYTALQLTRATISNDQFYASGIVACDAVIVHNYSGGIIEMKLNAAATVTLNLQPDRSYHFSGGNKSDFRFKSAIANYSLEVECITL